MEAIGNEAMRNEAEMLCDEMIELKWKSIAMTGRDKEMRCMDPM